jgi:hypothetical protein
LTTRAGCLADAAAVARLWTAANVARRAEIGLPLGPVAGEDIVGAEHRFIAGLLVERHSRYLPSTTANWLRWCSCYRLSIRMVPARIRCLGSPTSRWSPCIPTDGGGVLLLLSWMWPSVMPGTGDLPALSCGPTRRTDALSGYMNVLVGCHRDEGRSTTRASRFGTTYANCEHPHMPLIWVVWSVPGLAHRVELICVFDAVTPFRRPGGDAL